MLVVRNLSRLRSIALAFWCVTCLVPALLVSLSRTVGPRLQPEQLTSLYGREMAAYLSYCPEPLLAYLMPLPCCCSWQRWAASVALHAPSAMLCA